MEEKSQEIKAEASMPECNHGGLEIAKYDGETVWWRRNWGEGAITEWKEAEIKYASENNDGESFADEDDPTTEPYFTIGNVDEDGKEWMYFISEFMRYDR